MSKQWATWSASTALALAAAASCGSQPAGGPLSAAAMAGACGAALGAKDLVLWQQQASFLDSAAGADEGFPEAAVAAEAIQALRRRLRRPCKSAQQLIETYEHQGLPKTSRILRSKIDLI